MVTRVLAALVGLAVILPALIWGGELAVEIIVGLVLLICVDEWANMAFPQRRWWALARLVPPALALYLAVLYGPEGSLVLALSGSVLWLFLATLFRAGPVDDATDTVGRLALGMAYVPGLIVFIPLVRRLPDGLAWVFLLLVITWMGDTGAYFAGRFLGRHKLYEKISPNKTWEGAIGGGVTAVVGAFVVRAIALPQLTVLDCVLLGIVVDAFGVCGDLCESMLKRSFGVKDSGWIMPGHGGILDRIDALLFTAPVLFLYCSHVLGL